MPRQLCHRMGEFFLSPRGGVPTRLRVIAVVDPELLMSGGEHERQEIRRKCADIGEPVTVPAGDEQEITWPRCDGLVAVDELEIP